MPRRNAEAANAGLGGEQRELHVPGRGSGLDRQPFDGDLFERRAEPDDDALKAAVAHQKIGAGAEHEHFMGGIEPLQEIGKIGFVRRLEQDLRRAAGAKPCQRGERRVG